MLKTMNALTEKQYDEEGRVIRANRSQLKRERAEIKAFAQTLLQLPARQYPLLPINETLQDALIEGKRLTGNALKRHLGYLTRLIEEQDEANIRAAHERVNHAFSHSADKMRRIQWEIKRLHEQDAAIFTELLQRYDALDVQYVRQLLRESLKLEHKQAEALAADGKTSPNKYRQQLQTYLSQLNLK